MNQIFDRKLLRQNQKRAAGQFSQYNFLYQEIADRIIENLQSIEQKFQFCLEIGARNNYLSEQLLLQKNVGQVFLTKLFDDKNFFVQNLKIQKVIADDEQLPFKAKSFDLIVSNLNLQHINLMPQFLLQIKNLLKPRGIFIASFFGEENLPELHEAIFSTENQLYGGVSPRMIPTIDIKTAANLLQKAGFVAPMSSLEQIKVTYSDPLKLLQDLKNMGQSSALLKRSRRFFSKNFLQQFQQNYQQNYQIEGGVRAVFEIITVVGFG